MAFIGCEKMSKYIKFKQILKMIKIHFAVSLVVMFMGLILPIFYMEGIKIIASAVFVFVYMLILYAASAEIAGHDKKSYTAETAYPWKGIILPVGIFAVWVFLYVMYYMSWKYGIVNMQFASGMINHFLFVMWNQIYSGFMNSSEMVSGNFEIWVTVPVVIVPLIACGGGYFAGYKGFDISEKVADIMYDKKNEEDSAGKDE